MSKKGLFGIILRTIIAGRAEQIDMAEVTPAALGEAAKERGIQKKASLNEIRQKYHEPIKNWHPDVSTMDPEVSHEMTIRMKKAYHPRGDGRMILRGFHDDV
jgi:hypothetical protein